MDGTNGIIGMEGMDERDGRDGVIFKEQFSNSASATVSE